MTAFRDQDRSELETFKKHIEIAETLVGVVADLTKHLARVIDNEVQRSRGDAWRDLWGQLDQARAIVVRLGRPIDAFDTERTKAGNPYHVAGGVTPLNQAMMQATRAAIHALRGAVPEVVIAAPAAQPTARDAGVSALAAPRRFRMGPAAWYSVGGLLALLLGAASRC